MYLKFFLVIFTPKINKILSCIVLLTVMNYCASRIALSQQSGSYIYLMNISMERCLL